MSRLLKVSVTLTPKEKEEAYRESLKNRENIFLGVTGLGLGSVGVGHFGGEHLRKKTEKEASESTKKVVDDYLHNRKIETKTADQIGAGKKRIVSTILANMKGTGRLTAMVGAGAYGIDKLTRHLDKEDEGLFDKKTSKGERDRYLFGTGVGLTTAGTLGSLYLSRKAKKAFIHKDINLLDAQGSYNEIVKKNKELMKKDPKAYENRLERLEKRRERELQRKEAAMEKDKRTAIKEAKEWWSNEMDEVRDGHREKINKHHDAYSKLSDKVWSKARRHEAENYNNTILTDEMNAAGNSISELDRAQSVSEYIKAREVVVDKSKKDLLDAVDSSGMSKRDLKNGAIFQGFQAAGGAGITASGAGLVPGLGNYNTLLEEKIKEKEKRLEKKAVLGAAGIHLGQAQLYRHMTETDSGRKRTAQFLKDRFTEGYTGERAKAKSTKATKMIRKGINFLKSPVTLGGVGKTSFASKRKTIKKTVNLDEAIQDNQLGAAYHLMPEAEAAAKEARHLGKKLKDKEVDLNDLNVHDKKFMTALADGDMNEAVKHGRNAPMAMELLAIALPGRSHGDLVKIIGEGSMHTNEKALEALGNEFKKTRTQPLMKALADNMNSGGLSKTVKGSSIEKKMKREKRAYNISHAGLTIADPWTGLLNGTKRFMTSSDLKPKKTPEMKEIVPSKNRASNKSLKGIAKNTKKKAKVLLHNTAAKGYNKIEPQVDELTYMYNSAIPGVNTFKKITNSIMATIPNTLAKAKGYAGKQYDPSTMDQIKKQIWSPALEQGVEDSQRMAYAQRKYLETLPKSKKTEENIAKLDATAKNISEKFKGYDDNIFKSIAKGAKEGKKLIKQVSESKDSKQIKQLLGGAIDMRSKNSARVMEGEEKVNKAMFDMARNHQDDINDLVEGKTGTVLKGIDKGVEEVGRVQERYDRWALPGAALGAAALTAPMAKDYYDRNSGKPSNSKLNKKPKSKAA